VVLFFFVVYQADWVMQETRAFRGRGAAAVENYPTNDKSLSTSSIIKPSHHYNNSDLQIHPGKTYTVSWKGKQDLKTFMTTYFNEKNMVCDIAEKFSLEYSNTISKDDRILLNITFGCNELFYNSGLGSGNFLAGFYAIRLAAKVISSSSLYAKSPPIDVSITCPDAQVEKANLLLPWITGYFPAPQQNKESGQQVQRGLRSPLLNTEELKPEREEDVCKHIDVCPIGYMYPEIQNELRRMAIALVGIPTNRKHPTRQAVVDWLQAQQRRQWKQFQLKEETQYEKKLQIPMPDLAHNLISSSSPLTIQQQLQKSLPAPIFPNTELDDAILHFRCGDLMNSQHKRFGFLKFDAFAKHISPDAQSIGIVTQPFDTGQDGDNAVGQTRSWDQGREKGQRCRIVVTDFVQYLHERFPVARITVHNNPDETIALTYARMIMANQTIAGISTFGVFPSIASFGTGYIRLPDEKSPTNNWLNNPRLDTLIGDKLELMEEPNILMVRKVRTLWEEEDGESKILEWFRDVSIKYD